MITTYVNEDIGRRLALSAFGFPGPYGMAYPSPYMHYVPSLSFGQQTTKALWGFESILRMTATALSVELRILFFYLPRLAL